MVPLLSQASGGGGAFLSSTHHSSLKSADPIPPLFSKNCRNFSISRRFKPLTVTNAAESTGSVSTSKPTSSAYFPMYGEGHDSFSFFGNGCIPHEGVIQFEKPPSSSLLAKWSSITLLAGGDVGALLMFSAIGRFSHGLPVFDCETFRTADPFIAGWFLCSYFLGGYSEEGRGLKGSFTSVFTAAKSWASGIPLGIFARATTLGRPPPASFILVTMGSTAVLTIGWRALFSTIFSPNNSKTAKSHNQSRLNGFLEFITSFVR